MRTPLILLVLALALPGRAALFESAAGPTRGGIPVTAVAAIDSPWAIVLLAADVPDADLNPRQRAALAGLARALAAIDLTAIGGKTKARADGDTVAISLGAPADKLDDLLRALDARLRARRLLVPAAVPVAPFDVDEPALAADAAALAVPAHPDALATTGAPDDPKLLREAAEIVLARARIVVVGAKPAAELLASAQRLVGAPMPPLPVPSAAALSGAGAPAVPFAPGTRVAEIGDDTAKQTASRVWFLCSSAREPKRAVLAALLGGRLERAPGAFAVAVDVTAERASRAPVAEGKIVRALEGLSQAAPPEEVVQATRQRVRAERLARLKDPEALAWAFALNGALEDELAAIEATTAQDAQALARTCAAGPRVVVRKVGRK